MTASTDGSDNAEAVRGKIHSRKPKTIVGPTASADRRRALWEAEYREFEVIPSSTRVLPSKALVLFAEMLAVRRGWRVLDAGCGNGRNAVYLAARGCIVDAIDGSETALSRTEGLARKHGVARRVRTHPHSLEDLFPFPANTFDLALDSYVFCHFLRRAQRTHYRNEMARVLKPQGILFSSVFSRQDAYYQQFTRRRPHLAVDPHNGITKRLYTASEIKAFFKARFSLEYFAKFEFEDTVLGRAYCRSILVSILRK